MSSPTINERIETFLAAIAAEAGAPDAAETHIETWLAYILSKLGGSGECAGLNGLTKFETLWENASPTSAFSSQTLTIDLSAYDFCIVTQNSTTSPNICTTGIIGTDGQTYGISQITTGRVILRGMKKDSNNNLEITSGYVNTWAGVSSGLIENNSFAIPLKIIGVKVVA